MISQVKVKRIKRVVFFLILFLLLVFILKLQTKIADENNKELVLVASDVDENRLFYAGEHGFKAMEPYEESYIHLMSKKLNEAYKLLLNDKMNVYYSVIPDKSYFVNNISFPKENYTKMMEVLNNEVRHMKYIEIFDKLSIEDYYKTDHHWRQEKLFTVVKKLGEAMGFTIDETNFKEHIYESYQGVYGKYMASNSFETLIYLTSPFTEDAIVEVYEEEKRQGVYLPDKLQSDVPYHVFISEPTPIVTITNPNVISERELIIFGDSFVSSLAPLLLQEYMTITIIDLRFVPVSYISELIEFDTQEVLFLYNTAVINRSAMLK